MTLAGNVWDWCTAVDQVLKSLVLQTVVHCDSQLVLDAFWDIEPVQLLMQQVWQAMVELTCAITARPWIQGSVSCNVPVYFHSFCWVLIGPTQGRMPQAELTWVSGCASRWFTCPKMVTHPGTNGALYYIL